MSCTKNPVREVPAFTVQSLQKNTKVKPPPVSNVYEVNTSKTSNGKNASSFLSKNNNGASMSNYEGSRVFRSVYDRGNVPLKIEHGPQKMKIVWKVPFDQIDYSFYLPLFFQGLMDTEHPYRFVAERASMDLIENGASEMVRTEV